MKRDFEIRVAPRDAADLAVSLSAVEGVNARLASSKMPAPKEKAHGAYSISFAELAPVIISVTGASAAFFSLATAILGFAKARTEAAAKKSQDAKPAIIVIQNVAVPLADFQTPEALAEYLESQLSARPRE
jgi:hypothetical protein